jgi:hypothetical protein
VVALSAGQFDGSQAAALWLEMCPDAAGPAARLLFGDLLVVLDGVDGGAPSS